MSGLELALAPSTRTPGLGLKVNFTKNAQSPGGQRLKICVIASPSSTGSLTGSNGTVKTDLAGPDDGKTFLGPGAQGHLALKAVFAEFKTASVDLVTTAIPAGVAASATVTFDDTSPVTSARTVTLEIMGRPVVIAWLVGETKVDAATKLAAAVNALGDDLFCSAANAGGTTEVCTLTAKQAGTQGNDIKVYLTVADGAGGTVALGGTSADHFTNGTLETNISTALTAISGKTYHLILLCTSNADAGSASGTSNPAKLKAHIGSLNSGIGARLQTGIFGATGTPSLIKTGTAALNSEILEVQYCQQAQSLPCEWAGAEAGQRAREISLKPVKNRIGMLYRHTLYGARDLIADALTAAETEDLLFAGVSPTGYDSTNAPFPIRPVTCYFKDSGGNADSRVLDTSRVDGLFAVLNDLQVALPQQYAGQNITENLADGEEELPPDTTEIGEVKEFVIARCMYWARTRGVLSLARLLEAIGTDQEPGDLIVQIDPTDDTQVDIVLPLKTVPILAKFSLVANQVE